DGTLTVNPASLTITASGATKTYGGSANLTGFTSSGLVNSDSISSVSLTSTGSGTAASVGSYTISAADASGTGLSNYSITY
ncbi:MBG domain-containing protein, partial [Niveispirillum fermenti]|uniref:MBG domain-containing protein n=1 Tax=Niveispirillum fermenti TaxID=1233113 RepID=UPI003A8A7F21